MVNKLDPIGKSSLGMDENLAALLAYLFSFIGGLIFFFVEKDSKFVKFHSMQSIIIGAGCMALNIVAAILGFIPIIGLIIWLASVLANLGVFVVSIIMMIKAYQGEWFELPIVGKIAMEQANK